MRMTSYFRSLVKSGTLDSSKSFALLLSVIIGAINGWWRDKQGIWRKVF